MFSLTFEPNLCVKWPEVRDMINSFYFTIHPVNARHGNARTVDFATAVVSTDMRNPIGVPQGDPARSSFVVFPRALYSYPTADAKVCTPIQNIVPMYEYLRNKARYDEYGRRIARGELPAGHAANLPNPITKHVGWRIGVFVRYRRGRAGGDGDGEGPDAEIVQAQARKGEFYELQIGEAFIHAADLVRSPFSTGERTVAKMYRIMGNDSGKLTYLTGRLATISRPAPHELNERNRLVDGEISDVDIRGGGGGGAGFVEVRIAQLIADSAPRETWSALYDAYRKTLSTQLNNLWRVWFEMEDFYYSHFVTSDDTNGRVEKHKILPRSMDIKRFHTIRWTTYMPDVHPDVLPVARLGLRLPIWLYTWPHTLRVPDNLLRPGEQKLSALQRIIHPSTKEKQQGFLVQCLRHTMSVYGIRTGEIAHALKPFLGVPNKDRRGDLRKPRQVLADMLGVLELAVHLLTLPAVLGKYRSDIRPTRLHDSSRRRSWVEHISTESQDLHRITGQTLSDDCEGLDLCTREMYLTLTHPVLGGMQSPDEDLRALATFLDLHYEFMGVAVSSAGEFQGSAGGAGASLYATDSSVGDNTRFVYQLIAQLDHLHLLRAHGVDTPSTFNNESCRHSMCKQTVELVKNFRHNSEFDRRTKNIFHQLALLMPAIELNNLVSNDHAVRHTSASTPQIDRAHTLFIDTYYESRARESAAALRVIGSYLDGGGGVGGDSNLVDTFAPITLCVESTTPTSVYIIGPSVVLQQRFGHVGVDRWMYELARDDLMSVVDCTTVRKHIIDENYSDMIQKELFSLRMLAGLPQEIATNKFRLIKSEWWGTMRYCSTFYRQVCHMMNVSMRQRYELGSAGVGLSAQQVGALSHSTLIDRHRGTFGVPMEEILMPDSNAIIKGHYLRHMFASLPPHKLKEYDEAIEESEVLAHLPPIHFGVAEFDSVGACDYLGVTSRLVAESRKKEADDNRSEFARSLLSRVLRTHVVMTRDRDAQTIDTFVRQLKHTLEQAGASLECIAKYRMNMSVVFGEPMTILSFRTGAVERA